MARYSIQVHLASGQLPPFDIEIAGSQVLAHAFGTAIMPRISEAVAASAGEERQGVAWKFLVRREDGSFQDLDPMAPMSSLELLPGATIHALDITAKLLK